MDPAKLETQLKRLVESEKRNPISVCAYRHFFDGSNHLDGILDNAGVMIGDSEDTTEWLLKLYGHNWSPCMVQPSAWLTPRETIEKSGPWNEAIHVDDDGEFFNRVLLTSDEVVTNSDIGCYYRKHKNQQNLSARKNRKSITDQIMSWKLKSSRILAVNNKESVKQIFSEHFFRLALFS